jgi:hypothetical protein
MSTAKQFNFLTPNQAIAFKVEALRRAKNWSQQETVRRLARVGLHWSRVSYAMAVSNRRVRKFDADAIVAFARALDVPIWKLFVPPAPGSPGTHGRPVKVRLRGTSCQREQETARIMEQVMKFTYDHGLLPEPQPLPTLPSEAQADLKKAVARVLKRQGIDLGPKEAARPSLGQIEMLVRGFSKQRQKGESVNNAKAKRG